MGEGAQDVTSLEQSTCDQGQAFQTDHRVASPIREPVISGDHGADFIARGVRACGVFKSPGRRNDKLVGGKNQLRRKSLARFRNRTMQQSGATLAFGRENVLGP